MALDASHTAQWLLWRIRYYVRHMSLVIGFLGIAMLASFVVMTWLGARRYGVAGLFVEVLILLFYFVFTSVSSATGMYEYDGAISLIGLAIQVLLLDCLLLPLACVALWKRHRASRAEAPLE